MGQESRNKIAIIVIKLRNYEKQIPMRRENNFTEVEGELIGRGWVGGLRGGEPNKLISRNHSI